MNGFSGFSGLFRTDLVDEKAERGALGLSADLPGCKTENRTVSGIPVTDMTVLTAEGERASGKSAGHYATVTVGKIWLSSKEEFQNTCTALADVIGGFLPPDARPPCLLASLGNKDVTADAVGPFTADHFIVTGHLKTGEPALFDSLGMRETYCVCPDVSGNTGMEAAQIIRGAVKEIHPGFVIAVDALACRRLERLATTVQICDTGISPGSGIHNARRKLDRETLGVPVIAIGVPTVVEAATLACDVLRDAFRRKGIKEDDSEIVRSLTELIRPESTGFFVTPKETDHIIRDTSKLIGYAVNLALHPGMTFDEMDEMLS